VVNSGNVSVLFLRDVEMFLDVLGSVLVDFASCALWHSNV